LGVKLDKSLNWDEHIEIVCKKVGAGIGILKRIKPYVPANTLISIYNALINTALLRLLLSPLGSL
jgi:hypothetical protein